MQQHMQQYMQQQQLKTHLYNEISACTTKQQQQNQQLLTTMSTASKDMQETQPEKHNWSLYHCASFRGAACN
jgi:hypothetical protein